MYILLLGKWAYLIESDQDSLFKLLHQSKSDHLKRDAREFDRELDGQYAHQKQFIRTLL